MKVCSILMDRRRACGKCGKAERFGEAFPSSCGESASRKSRRRPPIELRISIAAAFSTGRFLFLFWFFFLFLF